MIRLKQLLQELDMRNMQPYATQFVWTDRWNDGSSWMAVVTAESTTIQFKISKEGYSGTKWSFGFWMPQLMEPTAYTTSAARGDTNTTLSYLRILSTCLEAIRDFADTHDVESIDISGADSNYQKGQQKTRIYAELFKANAAMFPDFNIVQANARELVLQRIQRADATGVPGAKLTLPVTVNEVITSSHIICDTCDWKWPIADGGNDLYICHKCGSDNTPDTQA